MTTEWLTLIQNVAFPILAAVTLALYIKGTLTEHRATIERMHNAHLNAMLALNKDNNEARREDRDMLFKTFSGIEGVLKENTTATHDLDKSIQSAVERLRP